MRRLELLVQEVRDSADVNDINTLSIYEIMRYFNDGQKLIQKIIYSSNNGSGNFQKFYDADVPANGVVPLPDDIYAKSALVDIGFVRTDSYFSTLEKLSYSESSNIYGFALINDQIIVSERHNVDQLRFNYVYKLPVLSYRLGKVASVDDVAKTITFDAASLIDDQDFSLRYENFSVVDKKGNEIANTLLLDDFTGLVMTFDADADLSAVVAGQYVVCGQYGTSHSHLPDECEPFLMSYVQRRVKDKISSSDAAGESIFTNEERNDLMDLFADNNNAPQRPAVLDNDYLSI